MDAVRVFNKAVTKIHYIDADKYKRVSRSKTLCGMSGTKVWLPMAAYIGGVPICKDCAEVLKKKA